jgi:hypothetical protein
MVGGYGVANAPRLVSFSDGPRRALAAAPQNDVLPLPEAELQPVNLHYAVRNEPTSAAPKTRMKIVRRTEPTIRTVPVQRASFDGVMADEVLSQATLAATSEREPAPAPVLVVLEGEQFGADGPILWRLTVVHLTPAQQRVFAGAIPKQI